MRNAGKKAVNPLLTHFWGGSPPIPWNAECIKNWAGRCPSGLCGITAMNGRMVGCFPVGTFAQPILRGNL